MATLLSKVRAITGSTAVETADATVVGFLQEGINYVIANIPAELLIQFASSVSVTNNSGYTLNENKVIGVDRNGYPAYPVPFSMAYAIANSSSLHLATEPYPAYYIKSGVLYVKPDPSAEESATIQIIAVKTVETTTDETALYTDFLNHIIVNYGAALDFFGISSYWRTQIEDVHIVGIATALTNFASALPTWNTIIAPAVPTAPTITISYTDPSISSLPSVLTLSTSLPGIVVGRTLPTDFSISESLPTVMSMDTSLPTFSVNIPVISTANIEDALTKAQNLMDNLSSINVESYLTDDDSEMANAATQAAAQAVNRARAEVEKENLKLTGTVQEIQQEVQRCSNEIAKYRAEIEADTQIFTAGLSNYKSEVEKEVARVNASLARFQADVQREIESVSSEGTKYRLELEKEAKDLEAEIAAYQLEQKDKLADLEAATTDATLELQKWQRQIEEILTRYQADITNESQRYQSELAKAKSYLEEIASRIQTASLYSNSMTSALQNGKILLDKAMEDIQRYINNQSLTQSIKAQMQQEAQDGT